MKGTIENEQNEEIIGGAPDEEQPAPSQGLMPLHSSRQRNAPERLDLLGPYSVAVLELLTFDCFVAKGGRVLVYIIPSGGMSRMSVFGGF